MLFFPPLNFKSFGEEKILKKLTETIFKQLLTEDKKSNKYKIKIFYKKKKKQSSSATFCWSTEKYFWLISIFKDQKCSLLFLKKLVCFFPLNIKKNVILSKESDK